MPILTFGINHQTAPISIREKIAFNLEQIPHILQDLQKKQCVNEAVVLTTCNRTEVYTPLIFHNQLQNWIQETSQFHREDFSQWSYCYTDLDAVRHLLRVATGLNSMVLGEPQIFGQVKDAYRLALKSGMVGKQLQHLFQAVFAAAKTIRSETLIGEHALSLAYAITVLAKKIFSNLNRCRVLLIGAGDTIEMVATHLKGCGVNTISIANRTGRKAQQLAQQLELQSISIKDVPTQLKDYDILITATSSELPIIGKGMVESALKIKKQRRAFLMIDLAVPRDIEPETAQLEDVFLYNIDDLQQILNENLKSRQAAAKQAESLIELKALHYLNEIRVLNIHQVIHDYRDQLETLCEREMSKANHLLLKGQNPSSVLNYFAHNLINKIMHRPTVKLKQAAYNDQTDLLLALKELLK